jgi:hypothetical protein
MRADGFQEEVLARLRDLKTGQRHNGAEHPQIPLIDPTANVLALVGAETKRQDDLRMAEFKRQDDLRKQAESFQARLLGERLSAEKEAKRAEAGRIDALLAARPKPKTSASQLWNKTSIREWARPGSEAKAANSISG